jgi:hypothetical protein
LSPRALEQGFGCAQTPLRVERKRDQRAELILVLGPQLVTTAVERNLKVFGVKPSAPSSDRRSPPEQSL